MHVPCEAAVIFEAIRHAIGDGDFRAQIKSASNPYGQGDAGPKVAALLRDLDLQDPALLPKHTVL